MFRLPAWCLPTDPPIVIKTSDQSSPAEIFAEKHIARATRLADLHRMLFLGCRLASSFLTVFTPVLLLINRSQTLRVIGAATSGLAAFFIVVDATLQNQRLWVQDRTLAFSVADELNSFRTSSGVYGDSRLDDGAKRTLLGERVGNLSSQSIQGWLHLRDKQDNSDPRATQPADDRPQ